MIVVLIRCLLTFCFLVASLIILYNLTRKSTLDVETILTYSNAVPKYFKQTFNMDYASRNPSQSDQTYNMKKDKINDDGVYDFLIDHSAPRVNEEIVHRLVSYMDERESSFFKYTLDKEVQDGLRHETNYSSIPFQPIKTHYPTSMNVIDLRQPTKPSGRGFVCIPTRTYPSFTMCLHDREKDVYITANLWDSGVWDPQTTWLIKQTLQLYPDASLIDVGANIGYFSQLAAAMGHRVVAIEPVSKNIERFHAAAHCDQRWDTITLLQNVVSDNRFVASMSTSTNNQGNLFVMNHPEYLNIKPRVVGDERIESFLLNDLRFVVSTDIAIMKIDIEGHECKALRRSAKLFKALYIPYVLMEWMFTLHNIKNTSISCNSADVERMTNLMLSRGYAPFKLHKNQLEPLDPELGESDWNDTVKEVVWKHKDALDLPMTT